MLRKKLNLVSDDIKEQDCIMNNNTSTSLVSTNYESKYFASSQNIAEKLLECEKELNVSINCLKFSSPVEYIYNPVDYAFNAHAMYVQKYCQNEKTILFLGMNPGPFGMCQTGVPFGEVKSTREWLAIDCTINKPLRECPGRPILGFDCSRSEISGQRFWNLMKELCVTPNAFFKYSYVHNYCPLALMNESGKNVTPDEIKGSSRKELEKLCDDTLRFISRLLNIKIVVALGRYAEKKAKTVLKEEDIKVLFLTHPSPRSTNNKNWTEKALNFFNQEGLMQYLQKN